MSPFGWMVNGCHFTSVLCFHDSNARELSDFDNDLEEWGVSTSCKQQLTKAELLILCCFRYGFYAEKVHVRKRDLELNIAITENNIPPGVNRYLGSDPLSKHQRVLARGRQLLHELDFVSLDSSLFISPHSAWAISLIRSIKLSQRAAKRNNLELATITTNVTKLITDAHLAAAWPRSSGKLSTSCPHDSGNVIFIFPFWFIHVFMFMGYN